MFRKEYNKLNRFITLWKTMEKVVGSTGVAPLENEAA
jgi:hypothetical protein